MNMKLDQLKKAAKRYSADANLPLRAAQEKFSTYFGFKNFDAARKALGHESLKDDVHLTQTELDDYQIILGSEGVDLSSPKATFETVTSSGISLRDVPLHERTSVENVSPPEFTIDKEAHTIVATIRKLMPKVDGEGINWQKKALNLLRAVVQAMCHTRSTNSRGGAITPADILSNLSLESVENFYVMGYLEARTNDGEWSRGYVLIKQYLECGGLPPYRTYKLLEREGLLTKEDMENVSSWQSQGPPGEQMISANEQHAYRTSQLIPAITDLMWFIRDAGLQPVSH